MSKKIAVCGLDCEKCEARIATIQKDYALKEKVAQEWSVLNAVDIKPEDIDCLGCNEDGPKTPFCAHMCEIRKCAQEKKFKTCASCKKLMTCEKVDMVIGNNVEALGNLKELM